MTLINAYLAGMTVYAIVLTIAFIMVAADGTRAEARAVARYLIAFPVWPLAGLVAVAFLARQVWRAATERSS